MKEKSQEKQESIDSQKPHKSIGARIGFAYKHAKAYLEEKKDSISSSIQKNYQKLSHAVTSKQEKDAPKSIKSTVETNPPEILKMSKEQARAHLLEKGIKEEYIQKLEKLAKSPPGWKKKTREEKFNQIQHWITYEIDGYSGHSAEVPHQSSQKSLTIIRPFAEQFALELKASSGKPEAYIAKMKELLSTPEYLEKVKEQTEQEMRLYNNVYKTAMSFMALTGTKVDKKLDAKIRKELFDGLGFAAHRDNIDAAIDEFAKEQSLNIQFDELISKTVRDLEQAQRAESKLEAVSETHATTLDGVPEIEEEKEEQAEQIEQQVSSELEAEPEVFATKLESEQEELQQEEQEQKEQEAQEEVLTQSSERKSQKDEPNTQPMPVMNTDSLLSKLQSALDGSTATLGVKARVAQFEAHTTEQKAESKKSQDSEIMPQRSQVKSMINMFNHYQKSQHAERAAELDAPEKSRSVKLR